MIESSDQKLNGLPLFGEPYLLSRIANNVERRAADREWIGALVYLVFAGNPRDRLHLCNHGKLSKSDRSNGAGGVERQRETSIHSAGFVSMDISRPVSARFCNRCGHEVTVGARYCDNCGTAVSVISGNPVPIQASAIVPYGSESSSPSSATYGATSGGYGNLFSSEGRIGRLEYFLINVVGLVAVVVIVLIFAAINSSLSLLFAFVGIIVLAIVYVFAGIRRLHDCDQSGWLMLLNLVPLVAFVLGLLLLFKGGTYGPNRFGNPGSGSVQ